MSASGWRLSSSSMMVLWLETMTEAQAHLALTPRSNTVKSQAWIFPASGDMPCWGSWRVPSSIRACTHMTHGIHSSRILSERLRERDGSVQLGRKYDKMQKVPVVLQRKSLEESLCIPLLLTPVISWCLLHPLERDCDSSSAENQDKEQTGSLFLYRLFSKIKIGVPCRVRANS